jgi:hypothetical protein
VSIPTIIHNSYQNIIVTNKKVQFYPWLKKQLQNNNYHSYISDSNSAPFWSCWEPLRRIWPTYHRHISAAPNGYALTALNGSPHLGPPTIDTLIFFLIIPNGSPSIVKKFNIHYKKLYCFIFYLLWHIKLCGIGWSKLLKLELAEYHYKMVDDLLLDTVVRFPVVEPFIYIQVLHYTDVCIFLDLL